MPAIPQLTFFLLPDGTISCEEPSKAGRRKLSISPTPEIRAALLDQQDRIKLAEAKLTSERHSRVFTLTAANHSIPFASRTIGNPPRSFRPSPAVRSELKRHGYTDAEINLMVANGEITAETRFVPRKVAEQVFLDPAELGL